MIATIRIASSGKTDSKGQELLAEINRLFKKNSINNIRTAKVYRLEGISKKDLGILTAEQIAKLDELIKSFIGSIPDLDARINSILGA